MRGISRGLVAAAALVCTGLSAMAQTPVGNAGFEVDFAYDVPPASGNWTAFFGGPPTAVLAAIRDTTAPRTGSSAMLLRVTTEGNSFAGVQQPVFGITPGVTYAFKIWVRRANSVTNGVEYRIEWRDANGGFVGDQFALNTPIQSQLNDTYQEFALTAIAPAGASAATLVMAVQSFTIDPVNPAFNTDVYIDDASFGATSLSTQAACCLSDGSCRVILVGGCPSGAVEQAAGSTCSPNNCPPPAQPGACCNTAAGGCTVQLASVCTPIGGNFRGEGTTCSPNPCPTPCRADINNSGGVTVQDIFDFLGFYFAGCP